MGTGEERGKKGGQEVVAIVQVRDGGAWTVMVAVGAERDGAAELDTVWMKVDRACRWTTRMEQGTGKNKVQLLICALSDWVEGGGAY